VEVLLLGNGLGARHPGGLAPEGDLSRMREAAERAGRMLGATRVRVHDLPDNAFDSVPLLKIVQVVEQAVAEVRPGAVWTHSGGDLNVDHALTFRAVLTALRPRASSPVRELLAFEVPSSTEWAFGRFEPAFRPGVFVDVAGTLEQKIAALSAYAGELAAFPHPRSEGNVRALAAVRGAAAGMQAAEAFELVFELRGVGRT